MGYVENYRKMSGAAARTGKENEYKKKTIKKLKT